MITKTYPLVSIVTPVYNQAEYLAETIDSVLAQDYPNIEYIVLDDGSTDETPAVLQGYDGRVHHERHPNIGQANTLNRGWGMARGSLIGYLSSDDRLESNAISKLVKAMSERPDAAVAYCDFQLIDAQGRGFRTVQTEEFSQERLCVDLVCHPGPGALFRREVFDQTGGWAGHLRHVPDFEFWLRASKLGGFVRVPYVLAHYRVHEGSASFRSTTAERSMEIVKVMSEYWRGKTGLQVQRSLATAYQIASKSHSQSGRFGSAICCAMLAVKFNRRLVFELSFWRSMLSGMLRRFIYKLRFQT